MKTIRFVISIPFMIAAFLMIVLAMHIGGERTTKEIVEIARRSAKKAGVS